MSFMRWFFCPPDRISKLCTIGTPEASMVAICRLKMVISSAEMREPALPNSGLGLGLTIVGLMPCLRSSALTRLALLAEISPLILVPRLSVPSQTNTSNGFERAAMVAALRAAAALVVAMA